jgi:CMP-N-acetylneuraminic acid synthetase
MCDGLPLVNRVVKLAKRCDFFDEIVVSTERRDVFDVSGAHIWHPRPDNLCQPTSSVWDAVRHYHRPLHDYLMLLHPTSPCLKEKTVRLAFEHMLKHEQACDAIVTISSANPYSWSSKRVPRTFTTTGVQTAEPRFQLNNGVFVAKWDKLYAVDNGYMLRWLPLQIPSDEAIDIDDVTDLHMAEAVLQWRRRHGKTP